MFPLFSSDADAVASHMTKTAPNFLPSLPFSSSLSAVTLHFICHGQRCLFSSLSFPAPPSFFFASFSLLCFQVQNFIHRPLTPILSFSFFPPSMCQKIFCPLNSVSSLISVGFITYLFILQVGRIFKCNHSGDFQTLLSISALTLHSTFVDSVYCFRDFVEQDCIPSQR